jgi:hypothetical protein
VTDYEEFSGILLCVDLVRTNVSEERISSIIRVTKIVELRTLAEIFLRSVLGLLLTTNGVPSSLIIFKLEATVCSETSGIPRVTRHSTK